MNNQSSNQLSKIKKKVLNGFNMSMNNSNQFISGKKYNSNKYKLNNRQLKMNNRHLIHKIV